ncbi:MAG: MBOAT family protein, partial [Eubacterium sp.]|nr:MBOAT family protein [Eubacterium sp.]
LVCRMLIFRAENLLTAVMMLKSAFDGIDFSVLIPGNHNGFNLSLYDYAVIIIGFFILIAVGVIKEKGIDIKERIYKLPYILKVIIYTSLLMMIIIIGAYGEGYGVVDLIYANF